MRTRALAAVGLVVAVALALVALTLPESTPKADYCTVLREHVDTLRAYTGPGDTAHLDTAIGQARTLTDVAPDNLTDAWRTLADYLVRLRDAGTDQAKLQAIASDPAGQQVAAANNAISEQGASGCGVNMSS